MYPFYSPTVLGMTITRRLDRRKCIVEGWRLQDVWSERILGTNILSSSFIIYTYWNNSWIKKHAYCQTSNYKFSWVLLSIKHKNWAIYAEHWCSAQRKIARKQGTASSWLLDLTVQETQTQFICSEQQDRDPVPFPGVILRIGNTKPLQRAASSGIKMSVLMAAQMLPLGDVAFRNCCFWVIMDCWNY